MKKKTQIILMHQRFRLLHVIYIYYFGTCTMLIRSICIFKVDLLFVIKHTIIFSLSVYKLFMYCLSEPTEHIVQCDTDPVDYQ